MCQAFVQLVRTGLEGAVQVRSRESLGMLVKPSGTVGGALANPTIPDRLREVAPHEIFARVEVQGSQVLAVRPQPNEKRVVARAGGAPRGAACGNGRGERI